MQIVDGPVCTVRTLCYAQYETNAMLIKGPIHESMVLQRETELIGLENIIDCVTGKHWNNCVFRVAVRQQPYAALIRV